MVIRDGRSPRFSDDSSGPHHPVEPPPTMLLTRSPLLCNPRSMALVDRTNEGTHPLCPQSAYASRVAEATPAWGWPPPPTCTTAPFTATPSYTPFLLHRLLVLRDPFLFREPVSSPRCTPSAHPRAAFFTFLLPLFRSSPDRSSRGGNRRRTSMIRPAIGAREVKGK